MICPTEEVDLQKASTFIGDLPAGEGETEAMCLAGDAVKSERFQCLQFSLRNLLKR